MDNNKSYPDFIHSYPQFFHRCITTWKSYPHSLKQLLKRCEAYRQRKRRGIWQTYPHIHSPYYYVYISIYIEILIVVVGAVDMWITYVQSYLIPIGVQSGNIVVRIVSSNVPTLNANWYKSPWARSTLRHAQHKDF